MCGTSRFEARINLNSSKMTFSSKATFNAEAKKDRGGKNRRKRGGEMFE